MGGLRAALLACCRNQHSKRWEGLHTAGVGDRKWAALIDGSGTTSLGLLTEMVPEFIRIRGREEKSKSPP